MSPGFSRFTSALVRRSQRAVPCRKLSAAAEAGRASAKGVVFSRSQKWTVEGKDQCEYSTNKAALRVIISYDL